MFKNSRYNEFKTKKSNMACLFINMKSHHDIMNRSNVAFSILFAVLFSGLTLFLSATTALGQVSGYVFLIEESESNRTPLSDVLVTDGYSFEHTDENGFYQIELSDKARWVAFINPRGMMPSEQLHHMLPENREDIERSEFNFTVSRLPHEQEKPFRFIHNSDIHHTSESHIERNYQNIVRHIHRMPERPSFLINSGDVSNDTQERMEWAREHFNDYEIPVFVAIGNHDKDDDVEAYRGETMERLFQPVYFAFTYDNYLFLNYAWDTDHDEAVDWTNELLNRIGRDYYIIVNQHHWWGLRGRYADLYELLRQYDAKAALSGHYHTNHVMNIDGLSSFAVTKGGLGHIRDLAFPFSFNVFTAYPDGRLVADYRNGGFEQFLRLVFPAKNAPFWQNEVNPVQINAYDSAIDVAQVELRVFDQMGATELKKVLLQNNGGHAWAGSLTPGSSWPDEVLVQVLVTDETGNEWPGIEEKIAVHKSNKNTSVELDGDWGMYQGGPDRIGSRKEDIAPPLKLAWVHLNRNFGLSAPVVAGGKVFAGVPNNETATEPRSSIVALDGKTGEKIWDFETTGRSVRNTLASDGKTVVAHMDDGMVLALNAENGRYLWENEKMVRNYRNKIHPSGVGFNHVFLRGSPMISGDRVYLGLRDYYGGAIDIQSGEFIWSDIPDRGARTFANASWTLGEDLLYRPGGSFKAISTENGETEWAAEIRHGEAVTPSYDGSNIYYPSRTESSHWKYQALDGKTGDLIWRTNFEDGGRFTRVFSSAAVGDEYVYFALGQSGNVYALDKTNGKIIWTMEDLDGDIGFGIEASVVLAGNHLYVVNTNGRLFVLDSGTGEIVWEFDLHTKVSSGMAVSGNTLFISGRNGALYAFVPASVDE